MWKSAKTKHIEFLQSQVAQLQNYILMTGGAPQTSFPAWEQKTEAEPGPGIKSYRNEAQKLYTSELEEDVEYQLQEGLIDQSEAQRILANADAIAEDIEAI